MKKRLLIYSGLLCLVQLSNSQTPIVFEAESGTIGVTTPTAFPVEWRTKTYLGNTFIVDTVPANTGTANSGTGTRANGNIPDRAERTVTYTVTFPVEGTYDLYVRLGTGPSGGSTNAFFYPSSFGVKPLGTDNSNTDAGNNWINNKPLDQIGFSCASDIVTYSAVANTNGFIGSSSSDQKPLWKWIHLSGQKNSTEAPVSFVVPAGALTQTFQIAARLHYVNLDKFAFCLQKDAGNNNIYYSVSNLDNGTAGSLTPPSLPYVPPVNQTPIASGKNKYIGCAYTYSAIPKTPNFTKYFNQVTPENDTKWGSIEQTDGTYNFTNADSARSFAKKNSFPFRFHTLVWGNQQPTWFKSYTDVQKVAKIKAWFQAVANHYDGSTTPRAKLEYIDVVNEALNNPPNSNPTNTGSGDYVNALKSLNTELGTTASTYDWVVNAFKLARRYFPCETKLVLNDYGVENDANKMATYVALVNLLKDDNLIDVVGLQAHYFSTKKYDANQSYTDHTAFLKSNIDLLATTGIPIQITELDIDGNVGATDADRDANQLSEYQRIFGLYWNHPSVIGITLWGYTSGMWDVNNAYLVSPCSDGMERPALRDYLNNTLNNNPASVRASVPTLQTFLPMVAAAQSFSIPENSSNGTLVGTITGTRINSCATLQNWTITSGNSASAFALDATTGALTVANSTALDFATKSSYTLTVNVSDGTLTSADQTVTVNVTKRTSVSVAESNGLKIYPNPSNGIFTIELNDLAGKTTLRIFDSSGKIVFQKDFIEKKVQVNQNLKPGVYFIKIFNDKGVVVEKITID